MNAKKCITAKTAILRALATMATMGIFPPTPTYYGFGILIDSQVEIDIERLLIQWAIVCMAAAYFIVREKF